MRRIIILLTTAALAASVVPAAQAIDERPIFTQRASDVCPEDFALVFDVAKAATVPIVVGKAKKSRPAGTARAQLLANSLTDKNAPSVCTMPEKSSFSVMLRPGSGAPVTGSQP